MRRKVIVATVVFSMGGIVGAEAAVFCQKRWGAAFVRNACQKKETQIDLAAFGAVGPIGDTGDPGPFRATLHSGQTLTGLYSADTYVNNGAGESSVFVTP